MSTDITPEVLEDVQESLERIQDTELPPDPDRRLDLVREALPTEPTRARLVAASLPPALDGVIEYVSPSDRQSGYWRRSPERSDPEQLSDAELQHRYEFTEAAIEQRGREGSVRLPDGREVPRTAAGVGDELRGEKCSERGTHTPEERSIISRIRARLGLDR